MTLLVQSHFSQWLMLAGLAGLFVLLFLERPLPEEPVRGRNREPKPGLTAHARKDWAQLTAEDAPGQALIRVKNRGARATLAATATVTKVVERVPNQKFFQTFSLRWRSSGKTEMVLASEAVTELIVASVGPTITSPPSGRPLHELLLEGYTNGQPVVTDRFRWHAGDPDGSITVHLAITLSSSEAHGSLTRHFAVSSREWGGIKIEEVSENPELRGDVEDVTHPAIGRDEQPALGYEPGFMPIRVRDIDRAIRRALPSQKTATREQFVGVTVRWSGRLREVTARSDVGENRRILLLNEMGEEQQSHVLRWFGRFFGLALGDTFAAFVDFFPGLDLFPEGTEIEVEGTIASIDLFPKLDPARIIGHQATLG